MTLGDCIKEYRTEHDLSQRQFADICGLSNAYISILERNKNPKTDSEPVPTYAVYDKIAKAMRIDVDELMEKADESSVYLGSSMTVDKPSEQMRKLITEAYVRDLGEYIVEQQKELLMLFDSMDDRDREKLLDYARYIVESKRRNTP